MNIHFNLVSPKNAESPIRVIITHRGKVYRKSIGLSTKTKTWNNGKSGNAVIDKSIKNIRIGLESALDETSSENAIFKALSRVNDGQWIGNPSVAEKRPGTPRFMDYFAEWAERDCPAKRQRKNTLHLLLDLMGDEYNWEDIDSAYYATLIRKLNEREYSRNYQGAVITKLKTVMSEGYKMKYHSNTEYKDFKKLSNAVDSTYLTEDELKKIIGTEYTSSLHSKCRDLLILGCYTGARWEDFSQFTKDNIHGKEFRYIQKKTGARIIIPCSPVVREALKRNKWKAPEMSSVVFNRYIKEVCMLAGINERIPVRISKGDKYEHKYKPKYMMISSHTCRRTCCTLLAKAGVPLNQIMMISGHKSLVTLQKYLRQTMADTADLLGGLSFFK